MGEKLALVQLLESQEPEAEAVEAQVEQERSQMLQQRRAVESQTWIDARRNALLESGELYVSLDVVRGGG